MNKKNLLLITLLVASTSFVNAGSEKRGLFVRIVKAPFKFGKACTKGVADAFSSDTRRMKRVKNLVANEYIIVEETAAGTKISVWSNDKNAYVEAETIAKSDESNDQTDWWLRRWVKNGTYLCVAAGAGYGIYRVVTSEKAKSLIRYATNKAKRVLHTDEVVVG